MGARLRIFLTPEQGLGCLYEKGDRGRKQTWKESDLEYLEAALRQGERTYKSNYF